MVQPALLIHLASILTLLHSVRTASVLQAAQCNEAKEEYLKLGYSSLDVPLSTLVMNGNDLEICPSGPSCCTREMEIQLASSSRLMVDSQRETVLTLADRLLTNFTLDIHTFFTSVINQTQSDLDEMFTQVYRESYTQHRNIFMNLFEQLKLFYNGDDLDLSQVLSKFFRDVFIQMFILQNPNKTFSQEYLQCVESKMELLKPFHDIPKQVEISLKQAMVASRTFIQALAIGKSTASSVIKMEPTAACSLAHMKMAFCSYCSGLPKIKPCRNYCLNVMKGCMAYIAELDSAWQNYTGALELLTLRIESDGNYNLETVLSPLKEQISSAIMAFHASKDEINQLTMNMNTSTGCGIPPDADTSSKTKRDLSEVKFMLPLRQRTTLRDKTRLIKAGIASMKYTFGSMMPETMCDLGTGTGPEGTCWNGEGNGSYTKPLSGDGLKANANNSEVRVDSNRHSEIIQDNINQLTNITNRVIKVLIGDNDNVEWMDLKEPLPNVTVISFDEMTEYDMSVKSSLQDGTQSIRYPVYASGDGSGWDSDDDDEGSGHILPIIWNRNKNKNNGGGDDEDEISGSGNPDEVKYDPHNVGQVTIIIKEDEIETVPTTTTSTKTTARTVQHSPYTAKPASKTTQSAPPSSAHCAISNLHTILTSLSLLIVVRHKLVL